MGGGPDDRAPFAGGDQRYLRDAQYGTTDKLAARGALHRGFATSTISLAHFEAGLIDWPASGSVLEVGSGTGMFWRNPVTPKGLDLTLTDLSPAMVDEACAVAAEHGFTSVEGRECDVQALPFDDDAFDVVVANHMLYHVPDPDLALAELARVLRPDGVLLAATNGHGHMREMNEAIAEVFGGGPHTVADAIYEVFGIDSGEARLRDRFDEITWHTFANDLAVTDLDAALAYGLSFPPGEDATGRQAEALREALAARFAGGVLTIRTRAGVFVARGPRTERPLS